MRLVEGKNGLSVEVLTFGQIAAISDRAFIVQRDALVDTLDAAQIGDETRMKELRFLLDRRGTRYPAILHAMTINGASDIVAVGCNAARVDFKRFTDGMEADDLVRAAQELIGMVLRKESVSEGEPIAAPIEGSR